MIRVWQRRRLPAYGMSGRSLSAPPRGSQTLTVLDNPAGTLRRLAGFLGAAAPPGWPSQVAGQAEPARIGASTSLPREKSTALWAAYAPGYAADRALHAYHPRSAELSGIRVDTTGHGATR
jgi:hypothetical protein